MAENETLSFKTINIFIEHEYLEELLERILRGIENLPKDDQIGFAQHFRKYVNVLGFRNPLRAPLTLRVNAYAAAFEEKDEVVPFTLSIWTKINQPFANQVKDWLEKEGWKNLSLQRNFEDSEGFLNRWPQKMTFDKLVKAFKKDNPNIDFLRDDLILMILWISGQLPPEDSEI